MEPLMQLAGDWKVSVERTRGGESTTSERTSKIELLLGDTLMQESFDSDDNQVVVNLAFDRFHQVYRRTAIDSDRGQIDVQQGTMNEDGNLVLDNLETGTSLLMGGRTIHLRTTYSGLSAEGFTAQVELSFDAGETWSTASTATYSR